MVSVSMWSSTGARAFTRAPFRSAGDARPAADRHKGRRACRHERAPESFGPSSLRGPYTFIHSNFLHLAFNLLALFVFGPQVEERMGGGSFLRYYLLCGLGGAALSFALMQFRPVTLVVGASAAVYGVLLAFAWAWPDQPINVFLLPTPIPAKWLVTFYVAITLVLALLSTSDGVAHLAHLGGFATGFLYLKVGDWRLGRAERTLRRRTEPSVLVHPGRAARASDAPKPPRRVERDPAQAEIDRVLDKISARGIDSLTPAERRFLAEMSRKMRDHTRAPSLEQSRRRLSSRARSVAPGPRAGARLSPAGLVPKLGPAASCSSISCRSSWRSPPRPTPARPITSISTVTSPCCRAIGTTTCWTRRRRTRNK